MGELRLRSQSLSMNRALQRDCRQFSLSPSEGERAGVRGLFLWDVQGFNARIFRGILSPRERAGVRGNRRSIIFLLTDFLHSFGPGENSPKDSRIEPLNVPQKKTPHPGPLPLGRGEGESSPVHLRGEVHGEGRPRAGRDTIQEIGLTNARHDLVCLHLHDPREASLPPAGLLTIEDSETGELLELDSTRSAVRKKFADTNAERLAELDRAFQRAGVDTLRFSTTEPFAQTLQHFFETRRGRRQG